MGKSEDGIDAARSSDAMGWDVGVQQSRHRRLPLTPKPPHVECGKGLRWPTLVHAAPGYAPTPAPAGRLPPLLETRDVARDLGSLQNRKVQEPTTSTSDGSKAALRLVDEPVLG